MVFVHVRENPILGSRFGIRPIPVQVLYDKDGKETFRHTGFYAEADVMKQILDSLGFQNVAITAKHQSDAIIQSWNIGKGTEKIVFSAYIKGFKPARKPGNESPG